MNSEFFVIQLSNGVYWYHDNMRTMISFGSVTDPVLATKINNLPYIKDNVLPQLKKTFNNAKIIKVKAKLNIEDTM